MRASPLRELARRYAQGEIGKANYQARRREIIEGLVSGRTKLKYRDTLADLAGEPAAKGLSPLHLGIAAAVVIGVGAAGAFLLIGGDQTTDAQDTESATAEPAPRPGVERVRAMLEAPSWTTQDLDRFASEWAALTPEARADARTDYRFQRLTHRVEQEIKQEEALAALGDETARDRADALEALREALEGA